MSNNEPNDGGMMLEEEIVEEMIVIEEPGEAERVVQAMDEEQPGSSRQQERFSPEKGKKVEEVAEHHVVEEIVDVGAMDMQMMFGEDDLVEVEDEHGNRRLLTQAELQAQLNAESEMVNGGDLATGATEEVLCAEGFEYEYEPATYDMGQAAIFQLYQPLRIVSSDGQEQWQCRICTEINHTAIFDSRNQYNQHRYKHHGTFNNQMACAVVECREAFASLLSLKRHLVQEHSLPLETHHHVFRDVNEFDNWRQLVEIASDSAFVMYNKQLSIRRQVMHCSRSDHKMVLTSKSARESHSRKRMLKEGACCPAHISFSVTDEGTVDVIYQMMHFGHADPAGEGEGTSGGEVDKNAMPTLAQLKFPPRAAAVGNRPMQFLQIDLIDLSETLYASTRYSRALIVECMYSHFQWARPLPERLDKTLIIRLLTDIFTQWGPPEGYSCSAKQEVLRDCLAVVGNVFGVQLQHIGSVAPDYSSFVATVYQRAVDEMGSRHRWVEVLPFTIAHRNQTNRAGGGKTPFELMFGRRVWYLDDDDGWEKGGQPAEPAPALPVSARLRAGEKVYVRNVDAKLGSRNRHGEVMAGLIAEVDWRSPFPYRVHYSHRTDGWASDINPSMWFSPFDIVPTSKEELARRDTQRREILNSLLCECGGGGGGGEGEGGESRCALFRSMLCAHRMSKTCCEAAGKPCPYHEEYANGEGDTYKKLMTLSSKHSVPEEERVRAQELREQQRRLLLPASSARVFHQPGGARKLRVGGATTAHPYKHTASERAAESARATGQVRVAERVQAEEAVPAPPAAALPTPPRGRGRPRKSAPLPVLPTATAQLIAKSPVQRKRQIKDDAESGELVDVEGEFADAPPTEAPPPKEEESALVRLGKRTPAKGVGSARRPVKTPRLVDGDSPFKTPRPAAGGSPEVTPALTPPRKSARQPRKNKLYEDYEK